MIQQNCLMNPRPTQPPDMGDLYKTPEKNQPGEWSINSNMQMVDCHPWGNDQLTYGQYEQPYMKPVQYMAKYNRRITAGMGHALSMFPHSMMHRHMSVRESAFVHEVPLRNLLRLQLYDIPCKPMELILLRESKKRRKNCR